MLRHVSGVYPGAYRVRAVLHLPGRGAHHTRTAVRLPVRRVLHPGRAYLLHSIRRLQDSLQALWYAIINARSDQLLLRSVV